MDTTLFNHFTITDLFLSALMLSALLQFFYWGFFYSRIAFYKEKRKNAKPCPVSVVICAKDEGENLKKYLPSVLTQNYSDYEVIVVNDCSEDNTAEILEEFEKKYPRLRTTTIKKDAKFTHGKKLALTIGIKAAKNEWLLMTDADCKPESQEWISSIQKNFTNDTSVVLGYGGYFSGKGFLNNYIRNDALLVAIQYLSFAMTGLPYMGVGRNLAYRRSVFFDNKGFSSHAKLASGDDDLFVNQIANKNNTKVEISPESHTRTEAKKTFSEWAKQKRRHLTTGSHYNLRTKWLLGGELISRVFFYISFLVLIISLKYPVLVGSVFVLRAVLMGIVIKLSMNHLNEKYLFLTSQAYDFVSLIVNFFFFIANKLSPRKPSWK
jgi:cellulose synthase/poly-beta-1,6-N-acetylglucosamine synthase-like glycosyltransferase